MGKRKKTPEQLREEAQRLLQEANALEGNDETVTLLDEPPARVEEASPAAVAENGPPARVDQDAPAVLLGDTLPEDDLPEELRKPDPPEKYDMSAELPQLRQMLLEKNYERAHSSAEGEIWLQKGTKFRASLLADRNGRIRLEIRNPDGSMRTEINPAWPTDVALALP